MAENHWSELEEKKINHTVVFQILLNFSYATSKMEGERSNKKTNRGAAKNCKVKRSPTIHHWTYIDSILASPLTHL